MVEDEGKQEDKKFDFTSEGETLGYISLDQARVLAMRSARETPGDYGRRFRNITMAFEVVEDTETEDHYVVTLSFRPQGPFTGTPGREQFFIEKEGSVAVGRCWAFPLGRRSYVPPLPLPVPQSPPQLLPQFNQVLSDCLDYHERNVTGNFQERFSTGGVWEVSHGEYPWQVFESSMSINLMGKPEGKPC